MEIHASMNIPPITGSKGSSSQTRSLIDVECSLSQGYSLFKDLTLALSCLKYSRSNVGKQKSSWANMHLFNELALLFAGLT